MKKKKDELKTLYLRNLGLYPIFGSIYGPRSTRYTIFGFNYTPRVFFSMKIFERENVTKTYRNDCHMDPKTLYNLILLEVID